MFQLVHMFYNEVTLHINNTQTGPIFTGRMAEFFWGGGQKAQRCSNSDEPEHGRANQNGHTTLLTC